MSLVVSIHRIGGNLGDACAGHDGDHLRNYLSVRSMVVVRPWIPGSATLGSRHAWMAMALRQGEE